MILLCHHLHCKWQALNVEVKHAHTIKNAQDFKAIIGIHRELLQKVSIKLKKIYFEIPQFTDRNWMILHPCCLLM